MSEVASRDELYGAISVLDLWLILVRKRWLMVMGTVIFGLVGVTIAFLWPRSYEAVASVFPVSSSGGSAFSQYAGLASLAGVDLPLGGTNASDPGKSVAALLRSRLLVETVVEDMALVSRLAKSEASEGTPESYEDRYRKTVDLVRKNLGFSQDKDTGVITVVLELPDPDLAKDVTNRVLEILDRLLVEKSLTTTRKKTESLTKQIEAQKQKVDQFQKEMAEFQKETDLLDPKTQAGQAMEAFTAMIQQRMTLELQLATAQASYSADNPRVTLLQNQLSNLDVQIQRVKNQVGGDLPSLKAAPENLIRYQNLARDLEIATRIYAGLLGSLEQAKLEDDKDQVYIEVLDRALLPRVGRPSRVLIIGIALTLGVFISAMFILANETLFRFQWKSRPVSEKTR